MEKNNNTADNSITKTKLAYSDPGYPERRFYVHLGFQYCKCGHSSDDERFSGPKAYVG